MKLEGTVVIAAPRERVWAFLTDPQAVARCTPGLESIEVLEPDRTFRAVASLGLGSIKTRFTVDVEWIELRRPELARAKAHGKAPGSTADIAAEMTLIEKDGPATEMHWEAEVTILGTIASLASRMMTGVAQKLSAQFFDCVQRQTEA